jgi:hypothetical protein
MENTEGLLLQGCGGDLKEWLDGINNMFQEADILLENTKFEEDDCLVFKYGEITCLLFKFTENTTIDMAKLAMWRLQTHDNFAGMWFSDYVDNRLGGFSNEEQPKEKPDCALIGQDGNIFNLMGIASRTLKQHGMKDEAKEMCEKVQSCGSYYDALNIIGEYVNITSGDESEDFDEYEEIQMS